MPTAELNKNNQANVSTGGGVKGGYCYSAPDGTTVPTDLYMPLDPAFVVMGFISEDGYVEGLDEDSEDLVDMNGDLMVSANSSRVESGNVTFAEIKAETLKRQYGAGNVTDENGMITVKHNSDSHSTFAYVLELVLRDGRRWRKCIPHGQSSELDELTIAKSELCQRPLTIKYLTDEAGNTCYDYIDSTETIREKAEILTQGEQLGKDVSTFGTFSVQGNAITGEAKKVSGYNQFSNITDEQEGYYLPLNIDPWEGAEVRSSRKPDRWTKFKDDGVVIVFLGKEKPDQTSWVEVKAPDGGVTKYTINVTVGA